MKSLCEAKKYLRSKLVGNDIDAALEADLILCFVCNLTRSDCYAHPNKVISKSLWESILKLLERRIAGEPLAYIIGKQEFWSMPLKVTADTLIPRPDTECLVEWVLNRFDSEARVVVDLGTGSGAIALALAKHRCNWTVHATDKSSAALEVATENAIANNVKVNFHCGDWLHALPKMKFDLIISNPPYIVKDDPCLPSLAYEPVTALVADKDGLKDLETIAALSQEYLLSGGYLVLEHGFMQADDVSSIMKRYGYINIASHCDLANKPRFVVGCKAG